MKRILKKDDSVFDRVRRLIVDPGDVIVCRVGIAHLNMAQLCKDLRKRTGASAIVVLHPGDSLHTLNAEQMRKYGWVRAEGKAP